MINVNDINKVMKLAKLSFSDSEITDLITSLNNFITIIDVLKDIDCNNVPLDNIRTTKLRMDKDIVTEKNITNELFSMLVDKEQVNLDLIKKEEQYYIVPKKTNNNG